MAFNSFLIWFAAFLGGINQTVTGFGGALTQMIILPFFFSMKSSASVSNILSFPIGAVLAVRYRKSISFRKVLLPLLVFFPVNLLCTRLAANLDLDGLKAVFGLFLFGLAIYYRFFSDGISTTASPLSGILCGAVAGITGAFFSASGPALVLYFLAVTSCKEEFLGTINFMFVFTELYSSVSKVALGFLSPSLVPAVAAGLLFAVAGSLLGLGIQERLKPGLMRRLIYVMLGVSGLVTFFRAIGII